MLAIATKVERTASYREAEALLGVGRKRLARAARRLGIPTDERLTMDSLRRLADHFGVKVRFKDSDAA